MSPSITGTPVIDEYARELLGVPAPLAPGLTAATASDLMGTWRSTTWEADVPIAAPGIPLTTDLPQQATVTFRADGSYSVQDCHTAATGRLPQPESESESMKAPGSAWVGDGSDFATPAAASDLMLCAPSWTPQLSRTRTIALDNGYLRLFDIAGVEQARLERIPG